MSLLMDALKKAEKEKKEAAKKKTGERPVLDTGEYPAGLDDSGQFDSDALSNTDSHEMPVGLDTSEMPLELEPLNGTLEESIPGSADESAELPMENTAEHEISQAGENQSLLLQDTVEGEVTPDFENTEEYQSVKAEIRPHAFTAYDDPLDSSYENTMEEQRALSDTQDDDIPFTETLNGVTASQLLQDIGQFEGQPTPVAANTVFEASKTSNWGNKTKLGLTIAMLIVIAIVAGLFIHTQTTPEVPNIPSPLVAKGVELTRSTVLPEVTPAPSQEVIEKTAVQHPAVVDAEIETVQVMHEELPVSGEAELGPLYDAEALVTRQESEAKVVQQAEVAKSEMDTPVVATMPEPMIKEEVIEADFEEIEESSVVEDVVTAPVTASISPAMIKISRIEKPKPEVSLNEQAYDAYQQGNYDVAVSMYQLSLEKTPDNRDALLGLAAINLRNGQAETAYGLYQKVLKLNPKDEIAKVALINLQGHRNTENNESLLKLLLKDNPESASTYFSLGNLYAKQLRWPEAQLAFFEAFTRRSNNPDYAMNLAVSLDQMGQGDAALKFYNKAIELADKQEAGFNTAAVLSRIKALTGDS